MKSVGVDIRIVNIPKEKVSDMVRYFIESHHLHIELDEEPDSKVTHIKAINSTDSCMKFWWKGNPQVIDWKIFESQTEKTTIETRFGFQSKYWVWYWAILFALVFLFAIFFEIDIGMLFENSQDEWSKNLFFLTLKSIFIGLIIILILVFTIKSVSENYDQFLDSFSKIVSQTDSTCIQKRIISNQGTPHILSVYIFILSAAIIFCINYGTAYFGRLNSPTLIILLSAVCIVLILSGMIFLISINIHFRQRLMFALVGISITIPMLVFYSVPFIIPKADYLASLYDEHVMLESILKEKSSDSDFEKIFVERKFILRNFYFMVIFFSLLIISSTGTFLVNAPRVAKGIIRWKREFFSDKQWILYQKPTIDFSGYARSFSISIFLLWITITLTLYLQVYILLCIAEFCIIEKNIFFVADVSIKFYRVITAITSFFLTHLFTLSGAKLLARLVMLIYALPLFWIIFKVIKKRINSYANNLNEIRKYSLRKNSKETKLFELRREISKSLNVPNPDIVLVPSKLPMIATKYIGMPYFRSYIYLSQGCLNMRKAELGSLLAHEIYHIKRHTIIWYFLNLLSDCTLFGNGFLAISTNSYAYELEADDYAAQWAKKRGAVSDFINALQIVTPGERQGLNIKNDQSEIDKQACDKQESFLGKFKRNIDMLFEIYFGEEILSYIHPPLEVRIERIIAVAQREAEA